MNYHYDHHALGVSSFRYAARFRWHDSTFGRPVEEVGGEEAAAWVLRGGDERPGRAEARAAFVAGWDEEREARIAA